MSVTNVHEIIEASINNATQGRITIQTGAVNDTFAIRFDKNHNSKGLKTILDKYCGGVRDDFYKENVIYGTDGSIAMLFKCEGRRIRTIYNIVSGVHVLSDGASVDLPGSIESHDGKIIQYRSTCSTVTALDPHMWVEQLLDTNDYFHRFDDLKAQTAPRTKKSKALRPKKLNGKPETKILLPISTRNEHRPQFHCLYQLAAMFKHDNYARDDVEGMLVKEVLTICMDKLLDELLGELMDDVFDILRRLYFVPNLKPQQLTFKITDTYELAALACRDAVDTYETNDLSTATYG